MNKTQLIQKAVEAGLDASGTVRQLKDRLKAHSEAPKAVTSVVIEKNPERDRYRHGSHTPKVRKNARNLQVES